MILNWQAEIYNPRRSRLTTNKGLIVLHGVDVENFSSEVVILLMLKKESCIRYSFASQVTAYILINFKTENLSGNIRKKGLSFSLVTIGMRD